MKHRIILTVTLIVVLAGSLTAALPPTSNIPLVRILSEEEALATVKEEFAGINVDIFLRNESIPKLNRVFFVDPAPMKGWMHDAYLVEVEGTVQNGERPKFTKTLIQDLPQGDFRPVDIPNRYGNEASSRPIINLPLSTNEQNPAAQRTHAVIISGGINRNFNRPRYWNDCSFIYQTLSKTYGIPKTQIYPLMADGTDPSVDTLSDLGYYLSQSLDLDFDGQAEIQHAATKANVTSTFNTLSSILKEDDHLFIYVIDHGGTTDNLNSSYICLWNNERLYDYELADLIRPITNKYVNVNVVLGQCYAGGFHDNLKQVGCVTASACKGSENSYAMTGFPFDEFVYHWTCAVNAADHLGKTINSDSNNDGYISMDEAFNYAKQHDRVTYETPQYQSMPFSIGEDLAFNRVVPAIDLYIKDNPTDTGKEPNLTTDKFWCSPSIWVRNQDDGIEIHENPYYASDHVASVVYVKIHNRGKKKYTGGKWAHVYWAQASTGFTDAAWKGRELYNNQAVTGEHLRAAHISPINPGNYEITRITWNLPSDLLWSSQDNNTEKHHFCLLAKIMDTHLDDGYDEGKRYFNVKGSNKQAQKNVSIIKKEELSKATKVFIRNVSPYYQKYSLELVPRTNSDADLFNIADVKMSMSQTIYEAWEEGGLQTDNVMIPLDMANEPDKRNIYFQSSNSRLKNICLDANEFDEISLIFNFHHGIIKDGNYIFDLIQKDENGKIVGGETFEIEPPQIILQPQSNNETTSKIAALLYDSPAKNTLTISFDHETHADGHIMITSVLDGRKICQQNVSNGTYQTSIETSVMPDGIYEATYISNGIAVDSKRFRK